MTQQRYRRRDGSWVWVEISFSLTREEEMGAPQTATWRSSATSHSARRSSTRWHIWRAMTRSPACPIGCTSASSLSRRSRARKRNGSGFALFCLDLDRFKLVNDTLGHQAGDKLLKVVAQRIKFVLRTEDASRGSGVTSSSSSRLGRGVPRMRAGWPSG